MGLPGQHPVQWGFQLVGGLQSLVPLSIDCKVGSSHVVFHAKTQGSLRVKTWIVSLGQRPQDSGSRLAFGEMVAPFLKERACQGEYFAAAVFRLSEGWQNSLSAVALGPGPVT